MMMIKKRYSIGRQFVVCVCSILLLAGCDHRSDQLALGTVERDRILLTATAPEIITDLPVAEGQSVTAGQLLVQLDTRLQTTEVAKARAEVAQAQAAFDKLQHGAREEEIAAARARVNGARALWDEAQLELGRLRKLLGQNLVAPAQVDLARSRSDSARAALEDAQEQLLQLTNGVREEDLRHAEAVLAAAKATAQRAQQDLDNLSVRATRDGVLDSLPWNLGERVYTGAPVAVLLADDLPYARVYLPEPKRAAIAVGDALVVRVDGVAESFQGRVRKIALEPAYTPYYALNASDRARLVYLTEIALPQATRHLPSGIPAQAVLP